MQQILTYAFLVIYTVTILGIVLVIITDNRNPLKTLPWIIVLVFAPVVGLVFYFFFGQNLSKQRIISRRTRKRITMQLEEALDDRRPDIPDEHLPLARLLAATIHSVPLYGSRITPYTDGKSKMEALLAEIARAKHHIHIQYYIFCDDTTGCRLRDALVAKARQGVEVRILYDDVGCSGVKKSFFEGMRREGIEAFAFLHVKFPLFTSKVNYRNHRKIAVIDGCVGFIGGMNIADRYVRGTEWGSWRDTHFRIEGSGAAGLQASFLSDWSATTKRHIAGAEYPADRAERTVRQVAGTVAGRQLRRLERPEANLDTDPLLPPVRRAELGPASGGAGRHRRKADAPGALRLEGRGPGVALLSRRHDEGRGEDSLLQTRLPTLQTADHRRLPDRHRLGEHGFPQLRTQFRGQRLCLRQRVHGPHGWGIRRRRLALSCPDARRMVQPPAAAPLGGVVDAGVLAAAVIPPKRRRGGDFRPASFVHRKTRGGQVVPTYVPFAPREGCAEIAA